MLQKPDGPSKLVNGADFTYLQYSIDKNSEDLAILILEFDDITVKTI